MTNSKGKGKWLINCACDNQPICGLHFGKGYKARDHNSLVGMALDMLYRTSDFRACMIYHPTILHWSLCLSNIQTYPSGTSISVWPAITRPIGTAPSVKRGGTYQWSSEMKGHAQLCCQYYTDSSEPSSSINLCLSEHWWGQIVDGCHRLVLRGQRCGNTVFRRSVYILVHEKNDK